MSAPMSPADARAADPAAVFAALGDPTRLALVARLSRGEAASIAALAADTRLTRQAVTKHLAVLERAGLVLPARVGRERRYAFRAERLGLARAYLDHVARQWDAALDRLRAFVAQ